MSTHPPVAGLVLAAGAGRRYGMPKALVRYPDRPLVQLAVDTLRAAGIAECLVVLGAEAERVRAAAPDLPQTIVNPAWADGMGSSLRAGLAALSRPPAAGAGLAPSDVVNLAGTEAAGLPPTGSAGRPPAAAALVLLVDMPGVTAEAVRRVAALAAPDALVMGGYGDRRGHPVLLGRSHWPGVARSAAGDRGARDYLRAHAGQVRVVPVGDVADDGDIDTPQD